MAIIPPEELGPLVNMLIQAAWNTGSLIDEHKYDSHQIELIIDSDYQYCGVIEELMEKYGDEVVDQISDAIKSELLRREEIIFEERADVLEEQGDELQHIREMIKGVPWDNAKRIMAEMTPAGDFLLEWTNEITIPDDEAEGYFQRLYRTIYQAGYVNYKDVVARSPYKKGDERYVKRLSELQPIPTEEATSFQDERKYEEYYFMVSMGWENGPPSNVEIYRGVSRADASLRPGEYVTTNRTQARTYIRGDYGKIIRETVPSDDLIIMQLDDWHYPEFMYFPREAIETQEENEFVAVPITFREFYEQVNEITASTTSWYRRAKYKAGRSLVEMGFPLQYTLIFCVTEDGASKIKPLDTVWLNLNDAKSDIEKYKDVSRYMVIMAVVGSDRIFESMESEKYYYNGKPIPGKIAYRPPLEVL